MTKAKYLIIYTLQSK